MFIQLSNADNEINVLLPVAVAVFTSVIGLIVLIVCWTLYRLIGKANARRTATILAQAVISLVGTAVIGLIAYRFAIGLQMVLSAFK